MNWYNRDDTKVLMEKVCDISVVSRMGKQASYFNKSHTLDFSVSDNNDGYNGKIQLVQNNNKVILTARILNDVYAFPLYEEQWHYKPDETRRAIKTFNRVVNILEDTKIEVEEDEMPGATLQGMIREELRFIDIDRKKGTRNRSLEAAKFQPGESDWRSSIYGNRYPTPPITITNHGDIYL